VVAGARNHHYLQLWRPAASRRARPDVAAEKMVSGSPDGEYLPRLLAGDRLLLIVYGEVTAGVDLGALDPSQLTIDSKALTITLPEASVCSTRLDNARTRVYVRETGLFTSPIPVSSPTSAWRRNAR
jgi:hypothetical protein